MHQLCNKWHANQLLKEVYKREALILESEQVFPAFEAFRPPLLCVHDSKAFNKKHNLNHKGYKQ